MKPFGFRVLVKVDNKSTENILSTNLLTGEIVEMPNFKLPDINNLKRLDNGILLYYFAEECLTVGTKILFNNDNKLVSSENDIYNVPIEFIRGYADE